MRKTLGWVAALTAMMVAACGTGGSPDGGRQDGGQRDGGADGGISRPSVTMTASPESGSPGVEVNFTANISGGTPPYLLCNWRYYAGASDTAGTISGNTCTGHYTYNDAGGKVVYVEVHDSASYIGSASIQYDVIPEGGVSGPDLIIKPNSLALVNPPALDRYVQGSNIQVTFAVKNIGLGAAGASTAKVQIRKVGGTTDVTLGTVSVNALAPAAEQSFNQTWTIPANQDPGVYDLRAIADSENAVTEDVENNNLAALFGKVSVVTPDGGV
jgi:hypothetical protein